MKKTFTFGMVALTVAGGVALCTTSAMAAKDNFDRATLGNKWVVPAGDGALFITNNQLQGNSLSLGYDKKSNADSTTSATVYLNGTDLEYGAVASGDIATGNNAFLKIQEQNGSGMFEYGGFYVGNNSGVSFFQLDSPVPSPACAHRHRELAHRRVEHGGDDEDQERCRHTEIHVRLRHDLRHRRRAGHLWRNLP